MLKTEAAPDSMNGTVSFEFRDLEALNCKNTPTRPKEVLAPIEDFIAATLNPKKQQHRALSFICKQVDLLMSNGWSQHLEDALTRHLRVFFAQRLEDFSS